MDPVNDTTNIFYVNDPCLSIFRGHSDSFDIKPEDWIDDDSPDEKSRKIAIKLLRERTIKAKEAPWQSRSLRPRKKDAAEEKYPAWLIPPQLDPKYRICETFLD